jgi:hypothetical protein
MKGMLDLSGRSRPCIRREDVPGQGGLFMAAMEARPQEIPARPSSPHPQNGGTTIRTSRPISARHGRVQQGRGHQRWKLLSKIFRPAQRVRPCAGKIDFGKDGLAYTKRAHPSPSTRGLPHQHFLLDSPSMAKQGRRHQTSASETINATLEVSRSLPSTGRSTRSPS